MRANPIISGVYTITNQATGKVYVGSSRNIFNRWQGHRSKLNSRRWPHGNVELQSDWRRYGRDAFVFAIVEECSADDVVLESSELSLIDQLRKQGMGLYNGRFGQGRAYLRYQKRNPVSPAHRPHREPGFALDVWRELCAMKEELGVNVETKSLEMVNRDDRKPAPYRYSDEVRELAFGCWIDNGGSVSRAYRAMVELCGSEHADENLPLPSELPDKETMRRWVKQYGWPAKMVEAVAGHFPAISAQQAARLIMQTNTAQEEYDAIMAGERDHLKPAQINARVSLITTMLNLRGLGTAGAKGGEPTISSSQQTSDHTFSSAAEANRYWLKEG